MSSIRPSRVLLVALVVIGTAAATAPVFAETEAELLRQIKSDLFDRKWEAVLANCDRFIGSFPASSDLARIYYYRAQALEHIRGRENDAIRAYGEFLDRFPNVADTTKEDAQLSRLSLATSQWEKGDKVHVGLIMDAMKLKGYPKIFAAIQASRTGHRPAHTRALPILKECAEGERDMELKNECVVAVLRIDPKQLPEDTDTTSDADRSGGSEVKLIRLEVFDKAQNKVVVRVNMPIAFAELILESVQDYVQDEIHRQLDKQGIVTGGNLDAFWKAIKEGGPQTILEVDHEDQRIKLWVE